MNTPKVIIHRLHVPFQPHHRALPAGLMRTVAALATCAAVLTTIVSL